MPLFPHYSEIKSRLSKKKVLERFSRRLDRISPLIAKLIVSDNIRDIINELRLIKLMCSVIYADIHVLDKLRSENLNAVSENKRTLRRKNPGVLVAFNILDLAIHYYKKKRLKGLKNFK
ncbi:MAG TPA: hypothetical protein ENF55_01840 [Thermoprotei archaeon]|nr:hypothetical protein [Thermoprotei archaeon]